MEKSKASRGNCQTHAFHLTMVTSVYSFTSVHLLGGSRLYVENEERKSEARSIELSRLDCLVKQLQGGENGVE